jgi:hypothetical protein
MTTTTNTVARLANETFGVEIETIGLSRADAARAVAGVIGGTVQYPGGGYDVWAAIAPDGRAWKCMRDGSLSSPTHAEVVSPILTLADMETFQAVVRALRGAGAKVDGSCGVHVHVGARGLGAKEIGNLAALVYAKDELIAEALKIDPARRARFCKPVSESTAKALRKAADLNAANVVWYGFQNARPAHYDNTRYHGLNLHNVWFRGTVEFRWFNGTLHAGEIRSYVMLCLGLVNYARTAKKVSPKKAKLNLGDKKWTMYRLVTHVLKLTGDDMANVREHLTKHLPGRVYGGNTRPTTATTPAADAA